MFTVRITEKVRSVVWIGIKILLSAALIYYLFSQSSWAQLIGVQSRIDFYWFPLYLGIYIILLYLMSRRYWTYYEKDLSFRNVFLLTLTQTVVGNLLTSSAGVLSYIGIHKLKHGTNNFSTLFPLVINKFFDFIAFGGILFISSFFLSRYSELLRIYSRYSGLVFVCGLLLFFGRGVILRFLEWLITELNLQDLRAVRSLSSIWRAFRNNIEALERGRLRFLGGYTVLYVIFQVLFSYAGFRIFSVDVAPSSILLLVSFQQFIAVLPIQVMGGLGVFDVTELFVLSTLGITDPGLPTVIIVKRLFFYLVNLLFFPAVLLTTNYDGKLHKLKKK